MNTCRVYTSFFVTFFVGKILLRQFVKWGCPSALCLHFRSTVTKKHRYHFYFSNDFWSLYYLSYFCHFYCCRTEINFEGGSKSTLKINFSYTQNTMIFCVYHPVIFEDQQIREAEQNLFHLECDQNSDVYLLIWSLISSLFSNYEGRIVFHYNRLYRIIINCVSQWIKIRWSVTFS